MVLPHPWPAVIVAFVATNFVTAAAVVLWSEGRLADQSFWASNRQKTAHLFDLVTDLAALSALLRDAGNETLAANRRSDALSNANGPATSLIGHATDLEADYRTANESVREMWRWIKDLGFAGGTVSDFARELDRNGTLSPYSRASLENLTRLSDAIRGTLFPVVPAFDAAAPIASFPQDPLTRLTASQFVVLHGLASQATCLHNRLYFGQDLAVCA